MLLRLVNRKIALKLCLILTLLSSVALAQPEIPDFSSLPPIDNLPVMPVAPDIAKAPELPPLPEMVADTDAAKTKVEIEKAVVDELPPIKMPDAPAAAMTPPLPLATEAASAIPALPDIPAFNPPMGEAETNAALLPMPPSPAPAEAKAPTTELTTPTLPDLPDFTDITEPEGNLPAVAASSSSSSSTSSGAAEVATPDLAPLPPPTSPLEEIAKKTEEDAKKEDLDTEPLPTIADLLEEETKKFDEKQGKEEDTTEEGNTPSKEDEAGKIETADTSEKKEEKPKPKEVVWPRSFKTQTLPVQIYSKAYPGVNNHLPKAVYYQEIEAHLFHAVGSNNLNAIRALLNMGVPLIIRSPEGETLLSYAVRAGAYDAVRLLLALHINPNEANANGSTPLQQAEMRGDRVMMNILNYSQSYSYDTRQADYGTYMR